MNKNSNNHKTYDFTLTLQVEGDFDAAADALYEAGCDDGLFGKSNGVWFMDFSRQAATFQDAVKSAVKNVESVKGVVVTGVEKEDA